jgi:hypothetical protein
MDAVERKDDGSRSPPAGMRWGPVIFAVLLICFSTLGAVQTYPARGYFICITLGVSSLVNILLRLGWAVPSLVAGAYAGIVFSSGPGSGGALSQALGFCFSLVFFAAVGLSCGIFLDQLSSEKPKGEQREAGSEQPQQ